MWGILSVQSAIDPGSIVAPVWEQFAGLRGTWFPILFDYAQHLFLMLALIEFGVGALLWMTQGHDVDQIGGGLFRKIMWTGFMYAVLLYSRTWIPAVIASFMQAGADASGVAALDPGEVVSEGVGLASKMFLHSWNIGLIYNPASLVVNLVSALGVYLAFLLIALQLLLTLIESYVVTGAGVFLLGFAAFRGTATISERYLSYVVAVGIKLFMLYLILGAGATLAEQWSDMITNESMAAYAIPLTVLSAAICYGIVAWHIPSVAASAISGTVGFGVGEVLASTFMAARLMPTGTASAILRHVASGVGDGNGPRGGGGGGPSGPFRAGVAIMGAPALTSGPRGLGPEGRNPMLGAAVPKLALPAPDDPPQT
jgi:type IV secretion system protein TrbL